MGTLQEYPPLAPNENDVKRRKGPTFWRIFRARVSHYFQYFLDKI